MKDRTCSLLSFSTYLNKGFRLRQHARQMSDARAVPIHPTVSELIPTMLNELRPV
jgi:hypothetical protein